MIGTNFRLTREDQAAALADQIVATFKRYGPINVKYSTAKQRSNDQNALFHVWCREIAIQLKKQTGEPVSEEAVKTHCKRLYGLVGKQVILGDTVPYLVSTTDYSKFEFMEFLLKTWNYWVTRGIILSTDPEFAKYKDAAQ